MQIAKTRSVLFGEIENCSLFNGLNQEQLNLVESQMERVTAPRGRLLIQNGDTTTDTYVLLSGSVIGQLMADTGREIMFTEIATGGYFGELAALDGRPRSITISASTDCVLAKLNKQAMHGLFHEFPVIAVNLAMGLAAQLRAMNDRVFGLVVHDVETRVRARLMQLAQAQEQLMVGGVIKNTPTHEVMASFVGANREAVSRAMAKLNKTGIIVKDRKNVVIKDLEKLLLPTDGPEL